MTSVEIRDLDPGRDARSVVDLIHETFPSTQTPDSWRQQYASVPPRAQHRGWVATVDGAVAGHVWASLHPWSEARTALTGMGVGERFRRRGIGSALWERAESHLEELEPSRVLTWFIEREDAVAFARARGFTEKRADALSGVDPRSVDFSALERATVDLVPLRDARPEDVYEVDLATTPDVPMTDHVDMPFDEWMEMVWRKPTVTLDGSYAALDEGRPVAITVLAANLEKRRGFNEYTGTLATHRGHGLATLVKLASLRWARDNGISEIWTTNDETNARMLSVNRRLGYEMRLRRVEYMRVTAADTASEPAPEAPAQ
jgi:GNAT superfamily N-acetyltransferase